MTGSSTSLRARLALGAAAIALAGLVAAACAPQTPPSSTTTTTLAETTTTAAPAPQLVVSKTTDLNGAGETVTVTGTGFDTSVLATRPPLGASGSSPAKPGGVYVVFGSVADVWQPTATTTAGVRHSVVQRWALPQVSFDFLGGAGNASFALVDPDGNFTTTIEVSTTTAFTQPNVGIYTYGGGGANLAASEIFVPVTFAAPPAG
jgi:large repetitive protein